MTNYVLIYSGGKMHESAAEQVVVMKAWEAWFGKIGKALVSGGDPFTGKAKTIAPDGKVIEGAGGMMASGFSVIQADSLEHAVELAQGCPVLQGGAKIMVYETLKVM